MSGLEFCKAFRALRHDRYGYFILLTSNSEKAEIAQGLDVGADDFLTKPVAACSAGTQMRSFSGPTVMSNITAMAGCR